MAEKSVFSKIIDGELPSKKLYEDESHVVILTIGPMVDGHCLVIPKKPVDYLWNMEDADYQKLMALTKKVALKLKELMGTDRTVMVVDGQEVAHTHIHLLPMKADLVEKIKTWDQKMVDLEDLEDLAKKLNMEDL